MKYSFPYNNFFGISICTTNINYTPAYLFSSK